MANNVMTMGEGTKVLFKYLQAHNTENNTAEDLARILYEDIDVKDACKKINGAFTAGIQNKHFGFRQEAEVELADGSHKTVKFLKLNDTGLALDVDSVETAKARTKKSSDAE